MNVSGGPGRRGSAEGTFRVRLSPHHFGSRRPEDPQGAEAFLSKRGADQLAGPVQTMRVLLLARCFTFSNSRNQQGLMPGRQRSHSCRCLRPSPNPRSCPQPSFGVRWGRVAPALLHPRGPLSSSQGKVEKRVLAALHAGPGPEPASPGGPARWGWGSRARPNHCRARRGRGAPVPSLLHLVRGSQWAACKPCPPSERRGKNMSSPKENESSVDLRTFLRYCFPCDVSIQNKTKTPRKSF